MVGSSRGALVVTSFMTGEHSTLSCLAIWISVGMGVFAWHAWSVVVRNTKVAMCYVD